jgi:SAM-dependent methyltransferase
MSRSPREIVRQGYDAISHAYRDDEGRSNAGYYIWLQQLFPLLAPGAKVLDLGCGCGVPATRLLAEQFHVTGVDFSPVQIERAERLVPKASFLRADITEVAFPAAGFDAIVSFFAVIHVPLEEQPALFARMAEWLRPGGYLLATVAGGVWTGTEDDWHGAEMYWSHADEETYRAWLEELDFSILRRTFIPEGDGGHVLFLAQKAA